MCFLSLLWSGNQYVCSRISETHFFLFKQTKNYAFSANTPMLTIKTINCFLDRSFLKKSIINTIKNIQELALKINMNKNVIILYINQVDISLPECVTNTSRNRLVFFSVYSQRYTYPQGRVRP